MIFLKIPQADHEICMVSACSVTFDRASGSVEHQFCEVHLSTKFCVEHSYMTELLDVECHESHKCNRVHTIKTQCTNTVLCCLVAMAYTPKHCKESGHCILLSELLVSKCHLSHSSEFDTIYCQSFPIIMTLPVLWLWNINIYLYSIWGIHGSVPLLCCLLSPLATSLNSIKTPKFITSGVITFRNPPLMITGTAMYRLLFNTIGTWWSNGQERYAKSLLSSRCLLCMCASLHMIYHNTLQRMIRLTLPSIMCADTEDVRKCSPNVFSSYSRCNLICDFLPEFIWHNNASDSVCMWLC